MTAGPAIFVGGTAIKQVWLFLTAPFVGAVVSACVFKLFFNENFQREMVGKPLGQMTQSLLSTGERSRGNNDDAV